MSETNTAIVDGRNCDVRPPKLARLSHTDTTERPPIGVGPAPAPAGGGALRRPMRPIGPDRDLNPDRDRDSRITGNDDDDVI